MLRILLIDNYDSYTFNLVQLLYETGINIELKIVKNDIHADNLPYPFDKVLISPGPGLPEESGNLTQLISLMHDKYPLFGVCLGHQAIAQHFGAQLKLMPKSYHGIRSKCQFVTNDDYVFNNLPITNYCGRYHSWVIDEQTLPETLIPTSYDEDGFIMAFRHKSLDIHAVQFHPESYMTEYGLEMMRNWLEYSS